MTTKGLSNSKYYASSWHFDDTWTVYANYKTNKRNTIAKVCTIRSVGSTSKFSVEDKRGLQALFVVDTSTGKTFALDHTKWNCTKSKSAIGKTSTKDVLQPLSNASSVGQFACKFLWC
jgi:frataxin-like iron-binding protein CyaY